MHIPCLEAICNHIIGSSPARGEDVSSRKQHGSIEECILEIGVSLQELLVEKFGVLEIGKEGDVEGVEG